MATGPYIDFLSWIVRNAMSILHCALYNDSTISCAAIMPIIQSYC